MARVLAYTSPARGDLYPIVPILDELRRRGHEIHVRTLAAEVERLAARGFTAKPIDERIEAIRHDDWKAKNVRAALAAATAVFVARAPHDAADLRTAIDAVDPDVLILDINPWGAMAVAEASGRPWAAVAPYPLPISSPDAPPFGPGLAPARGLLGRLRDAVVRPLVIGAIERAILPKLNAVRATIDPRLSAVRTADDLYSRPPLLLYLTAEPFEYRRRSWPANVRMVGPCSWEPELDPPAWLDTVAPPLVLVATSSEYQADAILAQTAFDALAGTEMTIIATLPSNDPSALRVPPNGRAEKFVPHGPILARASVAITHGGMGVTQKALAAGVPVVAVPFGRDQPEVARRVEVAGAGVRLPRARLRPETLRAAVATAMGRRRGALAVSEGYRAAGGPEAAASYLESLLGQGTFASASIEASSRYVEGSGHAAQLQRRTLS
jgi:MGT family glycosyltransferase